MGGLSSFDLVPSDYKIRYLDSIAQAKCTRGVVNAENDQGKTLQVMIDKEHIIKVYCPESDLTIGWLLSEVKRQYAEMKHELESEDEDKLIVALRTIESIPALDYYLTHLDNPITPIEEKTLLAVHFSKMDSNIDEINKESFHYLKIIGCGGYSNVVLARKKDTGRLYAIKIIKKDKTYLNTNKSVYLAESTIMKKLTDLPFIVRLSYTFQTDNELYFAMEPCIGGTLFHFITHCVRGELNINLIRFYMAEIIVALEKIHSKNIMYRDLKPENVLIDIDGHIKLSDFGLSKQIRKREETSTTFCGSPEYLPPEMLLGREHSRAVDFYTFGCLLYEMVVGFPPFHSDNIKNLEKRIVSGIIRFPPGFDEDAKDLVEWCLSRDPEERPQEFTQIKRHSFFNEIHWGKFAQKEVIPPWVPDLYTCHVSKRQSSMPLSHAFFNNPHLKEASRSSYNHHQNPSDNLQSSLYVTDQCSNSELRKFSGKIMTETLKEMLNLEGFESVNESKIEIDIKALVYAHFNRKCLTNPSTKDKSSKTKCSENQFVSENFDDSESDCSIDSEGGAYSMQKYLAPKNTLTKHLTYDGREPAKLEIKQRKKSSVNFKMRKQDYERINESCSSRNGYDTNYKQIVEDGS